MYRPKVARSIKRHNPGPIQARGRSPLTTATTSAGPHELVGLGVGVGDGAGTGFGAGAGSGILTELAAGIGVPTGIVTPGAAYSTTVLGSDPAHRSARSRPAHY